jgi:hypothetical protein
MATLREPGELRLLSSERTSNRLDHDGKGRLAKQTAGLGKRQAPLDPTVAFLIGSAFGPLAQQHPQAQRALAFAPVTLNRLICLNRPLEGHQCHLLSGDERGQYLFLTRDPGMALFGLLPIALERSVDGLPRRGLTWWCHSH